MLPAVGTASYNGYAFGPTAKTRLVGKPMADRANRTTTAIEYVLTVNWMVYSVGGSSCATQIADARQRLSQIGKELQYKDKGFGDITVNGNAGLFDLTGGPHPRPLQSRPVGNDLCHELEWSVSFVITECTSFSGSRAAIMAFCYEVDYAIDESGYTTVTHSGYLQVPIEAGSDRNADELRDDLDFPVIPGFRRTQQYRLSDDRSTLSFTISDTETPPDSLPSSATSARGSHRIRTDQAGQKWSADLQASYSWMNGERRDLAWGHFWSMFRDRINHTNESAVAIVGSDNKFTRATCLLTSFEMEEGLYEDRQTIRFAVSYTFLCSIPSILGASGFWRPISGTSSQLWTSNNTLRKITRPRGTAGLRFDASRDAIIDLCEDSPPIGFGGDFDSATDDDVVTEDGQAFKTRTTAYLEYQNSVEVYMKPGYSKVKLLKEDGFLGGRSMKATRKPPQSNINDGESPGQSIIDGIPNPDVNSGEAYQARKTADYVVVLRGYGVRAGKGVPCPSLVSFGESLVVPTGEHYYGQRQVGRMVGVPIYLGEWILEYDVVAKPDGGPPELPLLGGSDSMVEGQTFLDPTDDDVSEEQPSLYVSPFDEGDS